MRKRLLRWQWKLHDFGVHVFWSSRGLSAFDRSQLRTRDVFLTHPLRAKHRCLRGYLRG
jgi:hypothetical protein